MGLFDDIGGANINITNNININNYNALLSEILGGTMEEIMHSISDSENKEIEGAIEGKFEIASPLAINEETTPEIILSSEEYDIFNKLFKMVYTRQKWFIVDNAKILYNIENHKTYLSKLNIGKYDFIFKQIKLNLDTIDKIYVSIDEKDENFNVIGHLIMENDEIVYYKL